MTTETRHEYSVSETQHQVLQLIAEAPVGSTSFIGYGGAAGGAKTNTLANLALEIGLQCPGSNTLVARHDLTDLKETTLAEFDLALPPGIDVRKYDSPPIYRDVRLDSSKPYSRVWFKHLKDDPGSTQYGWVLIDEGHEVAIARVLYLVTRLRHTPEKKWGMVVGFNPFPGWCVNWFMKGQYPDMRGLPPEVRVDFHFVRSRMEDNPHLRAGYRETQEAVLDPYLKAIMVDGDPDAALGGLLYLDRQVLEDIGALCVEPEETIPTAELPGRAPDGEVLIWERPMIGERYYGGADTADGKGEALMELKDGGGSDRNAAAFYKLSDNRQVAAIYGRQEEHVFARLLNDWGRAYNDALLCVERNRPAVISNLLGLRYPNLYGTPVIADMRMVPVANVVRQMRWGYDVTADNRPVFLSQLREAVHGHVLKPRDKRFVNEGMNFLAGEKPAAGPGQHDDVVFSHGHAEQARRQMLGYTTANGQRRRTRTSSVLRIG